MRVLIVEDEQRIAEAVKRALAFQGYTADIEGTAEGGLKRAKQGSYDLVILDRRLPGTMDGAEVASRLRDSGSHVPILMMTAKTEVRDRVEGLYSGADDYLTKPFSMEELIARVRALLRRPSTTLRTQMTIGDLAIDMQRGHVSRAGHNIALSATELRLLSYLAHHAGQIVKKDQIITSVWNDEATVVHNTVEVYIGYLRRKIDRPFAGKPPLIQTVHGFGYRLGDPDDV